MRLPWPRSLLARNYLLLMALAVTLVCSLFVCFYQFMQKPRAEGLATLIASQINTQRTIIEALPSEQRAQVIRRINATGQLRITPVEGSGNDNAAEAALIEPRGPWLSDLGQELVTRLPPGSDPQINADGLARIRLHIDDQAYWLSLPLGTQLRSRAMTFAIVSSVLVAVLNIVGAWLIQRRINRPLRHLQHAASALGSGREPGRLPEDGPSELAAVTRQFNRMAESLERNDSMRALMLAGISHDIRTPLTKLRLLLAMGQMDEQVATRYITQIDAIVGQFLDFGRAEGDEPVAMLEVNTLVRQLAGEYAAREVFFDVQLDARIPALALRPLALQRAVANLMENAARYGRRGLAVATVWHAGHVAICISDGGPGIPPEQLEYLRRPFTRADHARSGDGGTGLGLAIVERLARLHGGSLSLETPIGGGLRATLLLPAAAA